MIPMDPRLVRDLRAEYASMIDDMVRDNSFRHLPVPSKPDDRRRPFANMLDRLLCEMDFRRLVLAERLARFRLAQAILRGDETSLLSEGRCR